MALIQVHSCAERAHICALRQPAEFSGRRNDPALILRITLLAITQTAKELKIFPGSQSSLRPGNDVVRFEKAKLLSAAKVLLTPIAQNSTRQGVR